MEQSIDLQKQTNKQSLSDAKRWWDTKNETQKIILYYEFFPSTNGFCKQVWNITEDEIVLMYWEINGKIQRYMAEENEDVSDVYSVDSFIKDLQRLNPKLRKLPLVIICPNGMLTAPKIKMSWKNGFDIFEKFPDQMVVGWE